MRRAMCRTADPAASETAMPVFGPAGISGGSDLNCHFEEQGDRAISGLVEYLDSVKSRDPAARFVKIVMVESLTMRTPP